MAIGDRIIKLESTASTNDYAAELLHRARPEHGTVILAMEQTHGRGTDGNSWESEAGKNLTFSVVLYPFSLPAEQQFYLNRAVSLALVLSMDEIIPEAISSIKWPNDIYLESGKVGGILISHTVVDNKLTSSIIGIGINVNQEVFTSDAPNPVSLKGRSGRDYNPENILDNICLHLDQQLERLKRKDYDQLDADYSGRLYRVGVESSFLWKGKTVSGTIMGVGESGRLMLQQRRGGVLEFDFKEITYII